MCGRVWRCGGKWEVAEGFRGQAVHVAGREAGEVWRGLAGGKRKKATRDHRKKTV